jgi:periplasmic copper chaperone A
MNTPFRRIRHCFFSIRPVVAVLLALSMGSAVQAHQYTAGDLSISHPHIPLPAASAKSVGGYLSISNTGAEADRLIGVEVPVVKHAMVHTTIHGEDGVARMTHLEFLDLPAGETVTLERGGLHVMMMGLQSALTEGQMVPATLIFEKAGRVEIEFSVDPVKDADHSGMNH